MRIPLLAFDFHLAIVLLSFTTWLLSSSCASMPSTPLVPTPGPNVLVVSALVVALCILCLGPAVVVLIHRLRRYSVRKSNVKDHRNVRLPPTSTGYGRIPDDLQVPVRVKIAASSPLRDSVLGTAIGQLSWPEAGKVKVSNSCTRSSHAS